MATLQLCEVEDVLRSPAFNSAVARNQIVTSTITDEQREFIQMVVDGVSADFEADSGRFYLRKEYVEVLSAKRQQRLFRVKGYPIDPASVAIKHSVSGDFASETAMDVSNYVVLDDGRLGMIKFRTGYGYIAQGEGNVQITYTGGLGASLENIPKDLRLAAIEQCVYILRRNPQLHIKSEAVSQGQGGQGAATTFYHDAPILLSVRRILNRYKYKG
jgi:hypothetical protein